jgi:hypothetical protein
MHIALRRPRSAQANNERITFVSALNQRNKRGYDVLLFRPPAATGKKAKAVTLYKGNWHKLEHDSTTRQPYLGVKRLNIHEFDGESLPLDNDQGPESSDEEPTAPRPQSDSSSKEELTQRYAPPVETTTTTPTTPGATNAHYRGESRELPFPNMHHSSIATFSQEQQLTAANMATQTTTATAATTTVRPNTPPATTTTTTQVTTMASQRIASHLQTTLWRTPGGSGGPGGAGNPIRLGGPGGPGGPPSATATPAAPAATVPANCDDRLMGSLPQAYEGD